MDHRLVGIVCALASGLAWALGAILYRRLSDSVSAPSLNLSKCLLTAAVLLVVTLAVGPEPIDRRSFSLLAVSGLLGIALGDTFFFIALRHLGAHIVLLLVTLGQVLTVVLAVVLLGESASAAVWAGVAMVIGGVAVGMITKLTGDNVRYNLTGILFGVLAVLCMAVGVIVTKRGIATVSALQATSIRMAAGVVGLLVWAVATRRARAWLAPLRDRALLRDMAIAVVVASLGGFWLSHVAIKHVEVSVANTLNSTEPLFVLPLAAIFLKEKIRWHAVLGAVIAVGGVVVIVRGGP
ncbi:MAG TPA: DMT family transporter [Polyangia bacterium]|jgi:drug/metabolite transporter (DMT)-like permease